MLNGLMCREISRRNELITAKAQMPALLLGNNSVKYKVAGLRCVTEAV